MDAERIADGQAAGDEAFMARALQLAARGRGLVSPNPMVGAVVVRDGHVLAEGYHHRYGDLHAERDALAHATADVRGATMYVTLEPCCHTGKQPPCTQAVVEAGISRVVVGSGDPNPLVAGKGLAALREHGIDVVEHVLEDECRALNEVFFHHIRTRTPFVLMKYASTLDGKIACHTGASRWVTGETARRHVHEVRHAYSAVMVGVGTVLADDPLLTCRIEGGADPTRIVCDTRLRTPLDAQVVATAHDVPTIVATCVADERRHQPYLEAGCSVVVTDADAHGHVDLPQLARELGSRGIDSVICEGGSALNWSALEAGIVDKVHAYIAPKLFGGADAKSPVGGAGFPTPQDAIVLSRTAVTQLGADYLVEGYIDHAKGDC